MVPAKGFSATLLTRQAVPYSVELVGGGIDQRRVVCEDSRLEIARRSPFHAEPCAGQVRRTDVGHLAIENQYLEVYARTQPPLLQAPQKRILVEIVGKVPPRLLGMDQPHLNATANQSFEYAKQRYGSRTLLNIEILDVGRADP